MPRLNNPMDILRMLDRSNCRECNYPTCLAFAVAVARGQKSLDACPRLGEEIIRQFEGHPAETPGEENDTDETLELMKEQLRSEDLSSLAERLGVPLSGGALAVKICGKNVYVDEEGNVSSEIHIHRWIVGPIFDYILRGAGADPSGEWVSFRELKDGPAWYNFFVHRCERPLKKVADTYPDLFHDMLHIFSGTQVENHYQSDISLVLYPLPKVPVLVCYWKPEDGLESSLNLFFDSTAGDNLGVESIYALLTGLVIMFEKIALRHGG